LEPIDTETAILIHPFRRQAKAYNKLNEDFTGKSGGYLGRKPDGKGDKGEQRGIGS
jgi:hypothetical protein